MSRPFGCFWAKECAVTYFGGAFSHMPSEMEEGLSEEGMELIRQAFDGIESSRLLDYHAHVIGLGAGAQGFCPSQYDKLALSHGEASI